MSLTKVTPDGFQRPRLLSTHVYEQLKALILSNELRPGAPLGEERLAAQWSISRTPLRAALIQLEQEGLVRMAPHKGAVVTDLRPEDVEDIYGARAALEVAAIQLAAPRIPEAALDETATLFAAIERDLAQGRYDSYIPSDARFHAVIMAQVPNRVIVRMLAQLYDQVTRIRNFSHDQPGEHMREAHAEHACILAALRRREPEAAGAAMGEHLRNVTRRAISLIRQPGPPGGGT